MHNVALYFTITNGKNNEEDTYPEERDLWEETSEEEEENDEEGDLRVSSIEIALKPPKQTGGKSYFRDFI